MPIAIPLLLAFAGGAPVAASGERSTAPAGETGPWDMAALAEAPRLYPAPDFKPDGARPLFFEGPRYQGRETRVFAWYGVPRRPTVGRVPAMVLVHGGGGTAFAEWVRLWTRHGYAALALDTNGGTPKRTDQGWARHAHSGPGEWGGFSQVDEPIEDQWTYHAVANIVLADSLLRSFDEVDPERIGVTGISWGGYLTCIAAGIDHRLRVAIPVYGCGYLGDNSTWLSEFRTMGPQRAATWHRLWGAEQYLPNARLPMLWVTGTNDFAFPLDSWRKSCRLPPGERTLCAHRDMPHSHLAGRASEEIYAFAGQHLKNGAPLPRITARGRSDNRAWVVFAPETPIFRAQLIFTRDAGPWNDRVWDTTPATIESTAHSVWADLPDGAIAYYFNMTDKRGLTVSSEPRECVSAAAP